MTKKKKRTPLEATASAALLACLLLEQAYTEGEDGGSVDWEDVDTAHRQAIHALSLAQRNKIKL